jgi:hypothetical protein
VAIAHQTAPNSNGKFQRENGIRFPILHDEGDVAVAYGIRWSPQELALLEVQLGKLPGLNTEISWMLPMQARYVIGADGMIAYTDINADYRHQPEPAEILPVLRRLQRGRARQVPTLLSAAPRDRELRAVGQYGAPRNRPRCRSDSAKYHQPLELRPRDLQLQNNRPALIEADQVETCSYRYRCRSWR